MADEQNGQHQVSWVISGIKYMINSSYVWENKYEHVHCKENKIKNFDFWRTSIIKWKTKNPNRKLVGGDKIDTPNTLIRDFKSIPLTH
jgi:hypothetical protein